MTGRNSAMKLFPALAMVRLFTKLLQCLVEVAVAVREWKCKFKADVLLGTTNAVGLETALSLILWSTVSP